MKKTYTLEDIRNLFSQFGWLGCHEGNTLLYFLNDGCLEFVFNNDILVDIKEV